jgi:hypothetical protein
MGRIRGIPILGLILLWASLSVYASDFYEWTDENGVTRFADFQLRESERLLQRLNIYASDNAVPQHWR